MSEAAPVSEHEPKPGVPRSVAVVAVLAIIAAAALVSPILARDYWDWGLRGLALTMSVGWLTVAVANVLAKRPQPWLVGFLAIGPWSLGLTGMGYVGFVFLPAEVMATTLVLRRVDRRTGGRARRTLSLAVLARSLACLPFAF